jgi:hypothetical protein
MYLRVPSLADGWFCCRLYHFQRDLNVSSRCFALITGISTTGANQTLATASANGNVAPEPDLVSTNGQ